MSFTIDETLETLDNFREEFYELLRTEFYRGTVRTLNATRLFFSTSYLTKFESTPAEVVVAKKRFSLSRFWTEHRSSTYNPILLIPPLMVTPQIYDLRPRHSFVRYLLERGFDVFLIDFGSPKRKDREIRLDDY
ncbi:MAG: hypothetical protein JNN15_18585, partial [Blastocatellia bacterium]|nr:hypothetical protein [Blastocatellia bacterium]